MQQIGRPREFNADEALSKIIELFWESGYEAIGLSDIIKATGLAKASLYAAFGNKQSMYLKALGYYELLIVDAEVIVLKSTRLEPLDRIAAFLTSPISAVRDHRDQRGCFLCNAAVDRASLDDETGKLVRRGYDKMHRAITATLGDVITDQSANVVEARAQLVLTIYSGLRVMARAGTSVEKMEDTKSEALATISALPVQPSWPSSSRQHHQIRKTHVYSVYRTRMPIWEPRHGVHEEEWD